MNSVFPHETDYSEYVEIDPSGRFGRYNDILGKGASKTVYRAFDEYEGIEVAWNQVKLYDFLQRPEDLERLYSEIHLLKTLKHHNIMKFYTSWVDTANRNINFVTEMFTSGTLRQYRLRHKKVNIRAVKHWCRQILKGLLYLHSRNPPVIHRDLKCDNIFVNGNQGEVKIGDLGLAAILRKSYAARCVGTPEFMAPEVYAEEYNELVDIYSFGMCILEMVTFEYPYSECNHLAQIYKKVVSGKKPDALYEVKDPEVRQFVEKCLASVASRLSAMELLKDPFLQTDKYGSDFRPIEYCRGLDKVGPLLRETLLRNHHSCSNYYGYEPPVEYEPNVIDHFAGQEDLHLGHVDITIKGQRSEDDNVFLRLRIADKEGRFRNIYFHFDVETDTALSVAAEMVAELDIADQDVNRIADMIDNEIASLVPEWKRGLDTEETFSCKHCASKGSFTKNLQVLQCSQHGCAAVHGRFEEITYQFEGSEQCVTEGAPAASSLSDEIQFTDIWDQHDGPELSSEWSREVPSDVEQDEQSYLEKDERITKTKKGRSSSLSINHACEEDYENEIVHELRWLKAKYQMQLRELRDQQLGPISKSSGSTLHSNRKDQKNDSGSPISPSPSSPLQETRNEVLLKSPGSGKHFMSRAHVDDEKTQKRLANRRTCNCEAAAYWTCSPEQMVTAKSFYSGALLPHSLQRAASLPVDAVDF